MATMEALVGCVADDRSNDVGYLRPDVMFEPLVCGWYAWSHLLAPAQQAMNLAFRHLPLLRSFVSSPAAHIAANRNPNLFGGPFVDLTLDDVEAVRQLIERTNDRCGNLLALARDLKELDATLQANAQGYSLTELLPNVPASLRGMVELTYDLHNHADFRLIEEFLYDAYADVQHQQVLLSAVGRMRRPFFMNTPRLAKPDGVMLDIAFDDPRLDVLCAMRSQPRLVAEVADTLDIVDHNQSAFHRLFTDAPPVRRSTSYSGGDVRLRYFGHACVLIETARTTVLIDPMFAIDPTTEDQRFTIHDLPDRIDYLVISHSHHDHFSAEMLLQIRHRVGQLIIPRNNQGNLADPSMKLVLAQLGYHNIRQVDTFDEVAFGEGRIVSLPFSGEHADLDIRSKHSVYVEVKGRRFMFLVDSDGQEPQMFRRIVRRIGKQMDALFLGMECHGAPLTWLYGPLLTKPIRRRDDESRRLCGSDCTRAWNTLQEVGATNVYVYAMGQEPWLPYLMGLEYGSDNIQLKEATAFIERCTQAGIAAERLNGCREFVF